MKNKIKFSIIVPVYNVEKYINKCIDSILSQTYENYEIIIVNDGSIDKTIKKLEQYKNNDKISIITQPNQGLSAARNTGIKKSKGIYLLFVDSDDYIDDKLLENINKSLDKDTDIVRFQARTVDEKYNTIKEYNEESFNLKTDDAISKIVKYHFVETGCLYCIKKDLLIKNNLNFDVGFLHEDFGLILILLIYANKISSINYIGYNYLIRNNSIMNEKNIEKTLKKCNDLITLGIRNINIIKNSNLLSKDILLSYIANSILIKGRELDKINRKNYYKKIKQNNIDKYIIKDTLSRKIKYIILKINYNLFLRVIK